MAYSAGMLNKRITIAKRVTGQAPTSATDTGKARYEMLCTVWAAETWNKGAKAMQAGVLDAYDTVMFRMRYRADVDRWCLIQYHGKWYQIQSLNGDYQDNQLQITATEMANQNVNIITPDPEPTTQGTSTDTQGTSSDENEDENENNVEQ